MGGVPSGRVEAAVARRLPHRSGLAAFPHPALLMSYPVSSRASSPDVNQPWGRERVGAQKSDETVPRHSALLSAPPYGSMPGSDGLGQEAAQAVAVAGDAIVCVMPAQHASQPSMLFAQRRVHPPFQLLPQFLQLADQATALGFAVDHEPPVQGLSAIVREAQKIERLWPPFAPSPTVRCSEPPELDQPRLVFVQAKPELSQPFRQGCRHSVRIHAPLEGQQESSSGGGSHLSALTEPDMKLSPHPAPTLQPPVARRAATGQTSWGPAARCAPASASTRVLDV